MKTRYILIHCEKELTPETVFYDVWVGSSQQQQRDLRFLQTLSFSPNFYFKRYDDQAAIFKRRVAESLFPGVLMPMLELKNCSLSVSEARALVRSGYFGKTFLPKGHSDFRCKHDVKFNAKMTVIYGKRN